MARASICQYKAGSTICLGESPVKYVHLILTGTVSAQNVTVTGKVSNWLHMPSPTFIGDLEVLAERRCYATNVATPDGCILARWPVEQFVEAMMEYPRLLLLFSQVLAKKNYNLSVSRGHAAFRPNLEKTVIYLLQYCETAPMSPVPGMWCRRPARRSPARRFSAQKRWSAACTACGRRGCCPSQGERSVFRRNSCSGWKNSGTIPILCRSGTHPRWETTQKQDASADPAPLNHTIKIEEATT